MYNIGQTCHQQLGRLDELLAPYAEFLKIARSAFSPNSRVVALVYKGITVILSLQWSWYSAPGVYVPFLPFCNNPNKNDTTTNQYLWVAT
jgi:hypothetical protein